MLSRELVTRNEERILKQYGGISLTIQTTKKVVGAIKVFDGKAPDMKPHKIT